MPPFHRRDHARYQHFELPRGAKLAGQPFHFFFERGRLRVLQNIGEQRHRRPQPAQPDPHLVHAFRLSREQRRHVVDHLLEACKPDGFEGVARTRSAR
jgi:hypothetical protein